MKLKTLDTESVVINMLNAQRMKPGPSNYDPEKKKAKHFGFHEVGEEVSKDGTDREGEIPDREGEGRDTVDDS